MTQLTGGAGARCPGTETIHGTRVDLEPVAHHHADALWAATNPDLWGYLPYGPFADRAAFDTWLTDRVASTEPRFYAIVPRASSQPAGMVALSRCTPDHGVIEIGHIWFSTPLQRTAEATDAVAAAIGHAFDVLGHRRVEWKCDSGNAPSIAAAERFGFTYEGTFRQHMIVKGKNRDTAWFSITDQEWPAIKAGFTRWLAPENFEADGRQIEPLAALR